MVLKNNTLYQYSGGGYSGNIWEWNFFFIDKDGKFHNIFSSGSAGITDFESAEELVKADGTIYAYCLDNEEDLAELVKETHAALVLGLVKWFEENQNNEVFAVCSDCDHKLFDSDEIHLEDTSFVCCDCHSSGVCDSCCEYVGTDNIHRAVSKIGGLADFSDEVLGKLAETLVAEIHHCEFCLESLARDIENRED